MARSLKVACIQNNATMDEAATVEGIAGRIAEAAMAGAELVAFPEYGTCLGSVDGRYVLGARAEAEHPVLERMCAEARRHGVWLLAGSLAMALDDGRVNNRSLLIDPDGQIRARYDKIHLFDVDLAGRESYRESDAVSPGSEAVIADMGKARLGLSICYDVRFPELYRTLAKAGAEILTIPAAFTRKTGRAHWHVLVRARAIETGCFVLAPGQCGEDENGRLQRYGHSLIVSPWGEVLADGGEEEGLIMAELDLERVAEARNMIPAIRHDRPFSVGGEEVPAAAE